MTYASLGTLLDERSDVSFPVNTGLATPAAGTFGVLVQIADATKPFQGLFGSGAKHTHDSGIGLFTHGGSRIASRVHDGLAGAQPTISSTANAISSSTWLTVLFCWDGTDQLIRIGDREWGPTSHGCAAATYTGKELWIGTVSGTASWDLNGGIIKKAVLYGEFLDASARASLTSLLAAEIVPSGDTAAEIRSRSPTFYAPLQDTSPTDVSANALAITASPSASFTARVPMESGLGLRTNGTCHLVVPYSAAVMSVDTGALDEDVQCEMGAGLTAILPALPTAGTLAVLLSMDDDEAAHAHGWTIRVHSNGSIEARVRQPWQPASMRSPAGLIAAGRQFHAQIVLGRDGLMCYLNGRRLDDGIKNSLAWHGLDRRERNTPSRNTSALRIGASGSSGNANIIVSHAYLFVRSGHARELLDRDCRAVAGAGGSADPHPHRIWGASTTNVSPGSNVLQAAIDARSSAGGGRVVLSPGTFTQSTDLKLKPGVELVGAGSSRTRINLIRNSKVKTAIPRLDTFSAPSIAVDQKTFDQPNSLRDDDVLVPLRRDQWAGSWSRGGSFQPLEVRSELMPVQERTSTTVTIDRQPQFSYAVAERETMGAFSPITDVGLRGLAIERTHPDLGSPKDQYTPVLDLYGARRLRMSDVVARENATVESPRALALYGCVDVWTDPEAPCTFYTDGADHATFHPYAVEQNACRGIVLHKATLHSRQWHAYDAGADNIAQEWPGTLTSRNMVLTNNVAAVECSLEGGSGTNGTRSRMASHGGVKGVRVFYCKMPNGGGLGFGGGYWDVVDLQASTGETAGIRFFYNGYRNYVYRYRSAGPASAWFQAASGNTLRECVFAECTCAGGSPNTGAGHFVDNSWRNIKPPNPPGTNARAAAPG